MSKLFSPIKVGGVEIKNRAWVSPMCQYSAVEGVIQDWHAVHYGSFITGGAGLVMVEATAVSPEGRISIACPGLWNEEQQKALLGQIPLGHLGKPSDVAHAVSYLAGAHAGYVTGQELHVNGGMFMN